MPRHAARPHVIGNFVTSLDGVVSLGIPGKAGGGEISGFNPHDRMVMGLLRAAADAVVDRRRHAAGIVSGSRLDRRLHLPAARRCLPRAARGVGQAGAAIERRRHRQRRHRSRAAPLSLGRGAVADRDHRRRRGAPARARSRASAIGSGRGRRRGRSALRASGAGRGWPHPEKRARAGRGRTASDERLLRRASARRAVPDAGASGGWPGRRD